MRSAHLNRTLQWRRRPSASCTRRTNEVPPIDAGGHFVRENIGFRAIPNVQTSPWCSSSIAICTHCFANHNTTASTKAAIHNNLLPTTNYNYNNNYYYSGTWKTVHMWNEGKSCMGRRAFRKSNKSMQPGLKHHGTHYIEALFLDPWQCTFLLPNFPNPHQDACAQICPTILKIYIHGC